MGYGYQEPANTRQSEVSVVPEPVVLMVVSLAPTLALWHMVAVLDRLLNSRLH